MTRPTPHTEPIRHGYTLADVDRVARAAVDRAAERAMDYRDRYDAAWDAVVVRLMAEEAPTFQDLWLAGMAAIGQTVKSYKQTHGYSPTTGTWRPAFERYWDTGRSIPSPEEQIIDRMALRQIWPALSRTHREMLATMAVYGDNVAAADAAERTYATFNSHLKNARKEFFALWHQGETPSRFWGKGDRRSRASRTGVQVLRTRHRQRERRAAADRGGEAR